MTSDIRSWSYFDERCTVLIGQIPGACAELLEISLVAGTQGAVRSAVQPLAVHTHARRHDQALHRLLNECFEKHRRAGGVGVDIPLDLVHALAHTHQRGEVHHRVDPVQGAADGVRVAYVAHVQLDLRVQIDRAPASGTVHLRLEAVQRAHSVALAKQQVGKVRADEAGTSGDQDVHKRPTTLAASTTMIDQV
jgi:hypothetical protein